MAHRLLIAVLIGGLAAPPAEAEEHLVVARQVREALGEAASRRDADVARLDDLLSTPEARRASDVLGIDPGSTRAAIPSLTDGELRELSARVDRLETDPVGGHWAGDLGIVVVVAAVLLYLTWLLMWSLAGSWN